MNKKLVAASLGVMFVAAFALLGSLDRAEAKDTKKDVTAERLAKFDELDY